MIKKISRQTIHIIQITLIYEICRDIFILLFFEFLFHYFLFHYFFCSINFYSISVSHH